MSWFRKVMVKEPRDLVLALQCVLGGRDPDRRDKTVYLIVCWDLPGQSL